ncbi:hypothetical protein IAT40_004848 [Kwoniella sp. CBS 6097]
MPLPEEIRERSRLTIQANFAIVLDDDGLARFKAFLEKRDGKGGSAKYLKPNGMPISIPMYKAFVKARARGIRKTRLPNGRTSIRATRNRWLNLAVEVEEARDEQITRQARQDIEGVSIIHPCLLPSKLMDYHATQYIETELKVELDLNTGALAKPIASFADFVRLLNACWSAGARYRSPRDRLQSHTYLLLHTVDMSRPGEAAGGSTAELDTDVEEGIVWGKDIRGWLFVPDGLDEVRVKYHVHWRNLKGQRGIDAEGKYGYHEQEQPQWAGLDATIFLTALGLEDGVFEHFSTYSELASVPVDTVRRAPGGKIELYIKESKKQTRLLQDIRWDPVSQGWEAQPDKAIRYSVMRERWRDLLKLCGYDNTVTMYTLRRMVLNACEAAGISAADRKTGAGQGWNSGAYERLYKSLFIAADTRRALMGMPAMKDYRMAAMGLDRLGDGPIQVPVKYIREASVPDEIVQQRRRLAELEAIVKEQYPSLEAGKRAMMPEALDHDRLGRKSTKAYSAFMDSLRNDHGRNLQKEYARQAFLPQKKTPTAGNSPGPSTAVKGRHKAQEPETDLNMGEVGKEEARADLEQAPSPFLEQ